MFLANTDTFVKGRTKRKTTTAHSLSGFTVGWEERTC